MFPNIDWAILGQEYGKYELGCIPFQDIKKNPAPIAFFFQFIILTNYESVLMSQYWLSSHALKQTFHGCGVMEGFRFWWRLIGAVIYRNVLPYPKYILEIGQETERNSGIKLLNVLTVLVLSLLDYVARGWVWVRGTRPLTSHRCFFCVFFLWVRKGGGVYSKQPCLMTTLQWIWSVFGLLPFFGGFKSEPERGSELRRGRQKPAIWFKTSFLEKIRKIIPFTTSYLNHYRALFRGQQLLLPPLMYSLSVPEQTIPSSLTAAKCGEVTRWRYRTTRRKASWDVCQ